MKWIPIDQAKKDGTKYLLYAPPYDNLNELYIVTAWNWIAGWCIDELRTPTHALEFPEYVND